MTDIKNMENLKNILSKYEVDYDNNDWIKLEKSLPKPNGMSGATKLLIIAGAVIVSTALVVFIADNISSDKSNNSIANTTNLLDRIDIKDAALGLAPCLGVALLEVFGIGLE